MTAFSKRVEDDNAQRIDAYLAGQYPQFSRSFLKNLIERGGAQLNGKRVKAGAKVRQGDLIEFEVPECGEIEIKAEDIRVCRAIGEHGLKLLKPGMGLLTHCNAGQLATSKYGTATAPMYLGQERGYGFRVFCDETRPLLQGARLTAFELMEAGMDTTLLCDNIAPAAMKQGWIDAVFVGCDRVAANGATANKIGTSYVAHAAKHFKIPLYVCAPTSTIDMSCKTGGGIHIELRPAEEVTEMWYEKRMAPDGVKVYNPSFDVTDAEFITAIITEYGAVYPPYDVSLKKIFEERERTV